MWDDPAQVAALLLAGSSREAGHGPWEVSERLVETGEISVDEGRAAR